MVYSGGSRMGGTPRAEDNVSDDGVTTPGASSINLELLRSLDHHFDKQEAVSHSLAEAMKEIAVALQAASMFSSGPEGRASAHVAHGAVTNERGQKVLSPPKSEAATPAVRDPSLAARPESFVAKPSVPAVRSDEGSAFQAPGDFGSGMKMGLGGIRAAASDRASRAIQNSTAGGDYFDEQDIQFNRHAGRFYTKDADGNIELVDEDTGIAAMRGESFFRDIEGNLVNSAVAAKGMRRVARGASIRNAVGAYGKGATLGESVAAGAPKLGASLGRAGLAIGAVSTAQNFMQGQTDKNAEYQAILGGSNLHGFRERLSGKAFDVQGFNPFNPGDTTQIYKDALELHDGDRTQRTFYQDQAMRLAGSTGMDASEINQVFRMATENGITSLGEIASSLEAVSEAAREAGGSAKEAREQYVQAFSAYGNLIDGSAASNLAASQAEVIASTYGANAGEVSIGNQEENISRSIAAQQGMNMNQMREFMGQNNGLDYAAARGEFGVTRALEILGPAGRAIISKFMSDQGLSEGSAVTQQQIEALVSLLRQDPSVVDEGHIATMLERTSNIKVETEKAFYVLITTIFNGSSAQSDQIAGNNADLSQRSYGDDAEGFYGDYGIDEAMYYTDGIQDRGWLGGLNNNPFSTSHKDRLGTLGDEYNTFAQTNRVRDPLIEKLIEKAANDATYTEESRFTVQTADGDVSVHMEDLFTHYLDQVSAGTVTNTTTGELISRERGLTDTDRLSSVAVTSSSDSNRGSGDQAEGNTSIVVIEMGPELQGLLTARSTNGTVIDGEYYSGTTPATAQDRPTG